jgi:RNA polymerase sigma-70 factor (ECF subfamily)
VAWRRLEEVPEEALPWLLAVARRTLANQRRARRRADALGELLQAVRQPSLSEPPPVADAVVLRAFAKLAEADREVLALVAWEGLTPHQAARALGITAAGLRVRLHRARRRFAAALEREEGGPFAVRPLPDSPIAKEV